jgi:hypothetical protein
MKFFTKEWFDLSKHSHIDLLMCVTKPAETFSEEYYQNLYSAMLKQHLRQHKQMSELTAEDVFGPREWEPLTIVNNEGEFTDAALVFSHEELEKALEGINHQMQEAYENYVPYVYNEEALIKQFDEMLDRKKKLLEALLPEDILRDVADIRVLALDKASKDIKTRIRDFCAQNEAKVLETRQEYEKYYKSIESTLPEKIRKEYGFHDCRVTGLEQTGTDVIIDIDYRGGFTNVCKIIYHNAAVIEQENLVGSWWLYDEIYIMKDSYEFQAALQDEEGQIRYFTVRASDVDFIKDTEAC